MKKAFIILKMGVYIQGVFIVNMTRQKAIEACDKLAALDIDDYHTWELYSPIKFQNISEGKKIYETIKSKTKK